MPIEFKQTGQYVDGTNSINTRGTTRSIVTVKDKVDPSWRRTGNPFGINDDGAAIAYYLDLTYWASVIGTGVYHRGNITSSSPTLKYSGSTYRGYYYILYNIPALGRYQIDMISDSDNVEPPPTDPSWAWDTYLTVLLGGDTNGSVFLASNNDRLTGKSTDRDSRVIITLAPGAVYTCEVRPLATGVPAVGFYKFQVRRIS